MFHSYIPLLKELPKLWGTSIYKHSAPIGAYAKEPYTHQALMQRSEVWRATLRAHPQRRINRNMRTRALRVAVGLLIFMSGIVVDQLWVARHRRLAATWTVQSRPSPCATQSPGVTSE